MMYRKIFLIACVAAVGALVGCEVGPNYHPPGFATPDGFGEIKGAPATATQPSQLTDAAPIAQWWRGFHDAELDHLVATALTGNQDLQIATARIRQARAQRNIISADLFPEIDATAAYNHARGSSNVVLPFGGGGSSGGGSGAGAGGSAPQAGGAPAGVRRDAAEPLGSSPSGGGTSPGSAGAPAGGGSDRGSNPFGSPLSPLGAGGLPGKSTDLFQTGFDATWELDIFGGTQRRVEAASDTLAAAVENRRDVMVSLLAEVARNYVELRGTQARLAAAQANLQAAGQILDLTRSLQKSGLTTQLDVARAAGQVAQTAATIPPLQTQVRDAIHVLGTLLGKDPNALSAELQTAAPVPPLPPEVPVGLPSELLRRRADIRRAERQLAAANARIGAATADLFPKFGLTGATGLDATDISQLFNWNSRYFLISPSVSWPLFDAGRIVSNISLQKANESEALLQYQKTVLNALREVEDALTAYASEQVRHQAVAEELAQNQESLRLARDQYTNGLAPFLYVLDAERSVFSAQDALSQSDQSMTANLVAVYKALGGGWEVAESP